MGYEEITLKILKKIIKYRYFMTYLPLIKFLEIGSQILKP